MGISLDIILLLLNTITVNKANLTGGVFHPRVSKRGSAYPPGKKTAASQQLTLLQWGVLK